jgi:hypothetical protein
MYRVRHVKEQDLMKLESAGGIISITSTTEQELSQMQEFFSGMSMGYILTYGGKFREPSRGREFCQIELRDGESRMRISGTDESDAYEVNNFRNICYATSRRTIRLVSYAEGALACSVSLTVATCKQCGLLISRSPETEWGICSSCADKCEHRYAEERPIAKGYHGSVSNFCTNCGRKGVCKSDRSDVIPFPWPEEVKTGVLQS